MQCIALHPIVCYVMYVCVYSLVVNPLLEPVIGVSSHPQLSAFVIEEEEDCEWDSYNPIIEINRFCVKCIL